MPPFETPEAKPEAPQSVESAASQLALEDANSKNSQRNFSVQDFSKAQSTVDDTIDGKGKGLFLVDEKDRQNVKSHMEKEATDIAKGMKPDSAAFMHMMRNYSHLQKMYAEAKSLGGDPKATMEAVLNKAIKDTGHKVTIVNSSEINSNVQWKKSVEATMIIDQNPKNNSNKLGKGIIGLGHIKD